MKLLLLVALVFTTSLVNGQSKQECVETIKECLDDKKDSKMIEMMEEYKSEMEECMEAGNCLDKECMKDVMIDQFNEQDTCAVTITDDDRRKYKAKKAKKMMMMFKKAVKSQDLNGFLTNPLETFVNILEAVKEKKMPKVEAVCENPEAYFECSIPKMSDMMMKKFSEMSGKLEGQDIESGLADLEKKAISEFLESSMRDCLNENESCAETLKQQGTEAEEEALEQALSESLSAKREARKQRKSDKCKCLQTMDVDAFEQTYQTQCGSIPPGVSLGNIVDMKTEKVCSPPKPRKSVIRRTKFVRRIIRKPTNVQ